jgi:hypothetical protein
LTTSLLHARALAALLLAAALGACGGGGGGGAEQTYPLRAALDNLTRTGSRLFLVAVGTGAAATQAVDGDCTGWRHESASGVIGPVAFGSNAAAQSSNVTSIQHWSNGCTPTDLTVNEVDYFDSNYSLIGAEVASVSVYGISAAPLPVIPASVKVGDSGPIGTLNFQASSTDTTSRGRAERTYAIEADTNSTAIINFISKAYDQSGSLTSTLQTRYRIDAKGNLTFVIEDKLDVSPAAHIVFRCDPAGCS